MKVKIMFTGKRNQPGDEYEARAEVFVDGQCLGDARNHGDCPEDANLPNGPRRFEVDSMIDSITR